MFILSYCTMTKTCYQMQPPSFQTQQGTTERKSDVLLSLPSSCQFLHTPAAELKSVGDKSENM